MSGKWEKRLDSVVNGQDWSLPDVEALAASLDALHPVLMNIASDPKLVGQSAQSASESLQQTAKAAQDLSNAIAVVKYAIDKANLARANAAAQQDALPPGELDAHQAATVRNAPMIVRMTVGGDGGLGGVSVWGGPGGVTDANAQLAAQREAAAQAAYQQIKSSINDSRIDVPLSDPDVGKDQSYSSGTSTSRSGRTYSGGSGTTGGGGTRSGGSGGGAVAIGAPVHEVTDPGPGGTVVHEPSIGDHPGSGAVSSSGSPVVTSGLGTGLAGALGGGAAMVVGARALGSALAGSAGVMPPMGGVAGGGAAGRAVPSNLAGGRGLASGLREGAAGGGTGRASATTGRRGIAETEGAGARGGAGARSGVAGRGARGAAETEGERTGRAAGASNESNGSTTSSTTSRGAAGGVAGRGGARDDRDRRTGRGLGGPIAPRLDEDADAAPRPEAAGSGGRE